MYIHQLKNWPLFVWDTNSLLTKLAEVHKHQGHILGMMEMLGFNIQENTFLDTLTNDVVHSSEIEGERLNVAEVRSSIARRLDIPYVGIEKADRDVEGVVEMMLDATQRYMEPLSKERLFDWHAALFPTGRSGMHKITVANWREADKGPMPVVSGAIGREKVHFEAPKSELLAEEMNRFLAWFNAPLDTDPILKAAIAHLWFVTVHPFDDGNGRIGRALKDMLLARADGTRQRFYSMSTQILKERKAYYAILEQTQKADLDITDWLYWFLDCLFKAMNHTEQTLSNITKKHQFWERQQETMLNARQRYMINMLFDNFYGKLTSAKWAKMNKCSADTALRDIQALIELGILTKAEGGGRSTVYFMKE